MDRVGILGRMKFLSPSVYRPSLGMMASCLFCFPSASFPIDTNYFTTRYLSHFLFSSPNNFHPSRTTRRFDLACHEYLQDLFPLPSPLSSSPSSLHSSVQFVRLSPLGFSARGRASFLSAAYLPLFTPITATPTTISSH